MEQQATVVQVAASAFYASGVSEEAVEERQAM